uniref:Uncharacterized protein n=1 Tax=Parascaris univalens TaxID=6257 RepID=A0A915CC99_PARUN
MVGRSLSASAIRGRLIDYTTSFNLSRITVSVKFWMLSYRMVCGLYGFFSVQYPRQ